MSDSLSFRLGDFNVKAKDFGPKDIRPEEFVYSLMSLV